MISTDQLRAIVHLEGIYRCPCSGETLTVQHGSLKGEWCARCVNQLQILIDMAREEGRRHPQNTEATSGTD